jgi:integrase
MAVYRRKYPDGRLSEDWYVSWYVGPRMFRKRIGPNKREADLFLKDIDVKRVRGELLGIREEKRIVFGDLADRYLEWSRGRKAPHTVRDEESTLRRLRERFTGLASKITRADIEAYLSERLETVGAASHNRQLSLLRSLFRKAVEWNFCRSNPADGIRKMKEPPGRVRFLSAEERERLLAGCSARLRVLVELALDTGLRKGELLSLRWENIDSRSRVIRIEKSKNGDRRDVPMTPRVSELLAAIPRRLDTRFLFANPDGSAQADLKTAWKTALERARIENFHFHDLRHTFASDLVMAGVDIRSVQTLLGHRDITMTMRYSHLSPDHLRGAISTLSAARIGSKSDQSGTALPVDSLTS